ncbi:hypothetical protein OA845_03395 [Candidatus Pelagibacter sp.]|nr:hypothetical protein [Candidatus Pelagibacter sp.]
MRIIISLTFLILLSNCSLNKDSEFWTENTTKKNVENNKLLLILNKSNDFTSMSFDEYKIYVEDYLKSSNYPDINK